MAQYSPRTALVAGLEDAGLRDCTEDLGGYYNADTEILAVLVFDEATDKADVTLTKGYDKNSRVVSFTEVNTPEAVAEVLSFLV